MKEILQAYKQKLIWERQFPINYYIVRPFSFLLTYGILKVTTNPAKVAAFGFIIGLCGFVFLACAPIFSLWPGIIIIIIYSMSDAVDGNVARTTLNVTLFGKYLDGLIGDIIDGNYFFFLGIGCYFSGTSLNDPLISHFPRDYALVLPLFLGAWIIICKLWASNFQNRYHAYRTRKEGLKAFNNGETQEVTGRSTMSGRWYYLIFINIETLNNQLLLLVILNALNMEIWFLIFFSFFYTIKSVTFFLMFLQKTKKELGNIS